VQALAVQGDGKLLIGGQFFSMNGLLRRCVARLRADGSLDTSFDPGLGIDGIASQSSGSYVAAIVLQSDEKALIGGGFTRYNGIGVTNVARLNTSGSLDLSFQPRFSTDQAIWTLALQTNGQILIGGHFKTVQGTNRPCVARLNADGSLDPSFDAGLFVGADPYLRTLAVQSDGKILIGGSFTSIEGYTRHNVARLNPDGGLDLSFDPRYGANALIWKIASQPDGKALISGDFYLVNDEPRNFIARLNGDGSLDNAFISSLDNSGSVFALVLQPDGKTVIGGGFTTISGIGRRFIARLNGDSSPSAQVSFPTIKMYAGLSVSGTVSNNYRIEYSTNLHEPSFWLPLTNLTLPSNPFLFFDLGSPNSRMRFYRAVNLP
jgi:uncharacterized delta-60 repeat protein